MQDAATQGVSFDSVDDVLDHWRKGGEHLGEEGQAAQRAQNLTSPTLSAKGVFIVGKYQRQWSILHCGTARPAATDGIPTKRQAVWEANALETMEIDGQLFDWRAEGLDERIKAVGRSFSQHMSDARHRGAQAAIADAEAKRAARDADPKPIPNPKAQEGARYEDSKALKDFWLAGGPMPGTKHGEYLAKIAAASDVFISPSGAFGVVAKGGNAWELVPAGSGLRCQPEGIYVLQAKGKKRALALAEFVEETIFGAAGERPDWSDPDIRTWAPEFLTDRGESLMQALVRARADFDARELPTSEAIELHQRIGVRLDLPEAPDGHLYAKDLEIGSVVLSSNGDMRTVTNIENNFGQLTISFEYGEPSKQHRNDLVRVMSEQELILRGNTGERIGELVPLWNLKPGDAVVFDVTGKSLEHFSECEWSDFEHLRLQGVIYATYSRGESRTTLYDVTLTLLEDGVPTRVLDAHRTLNRVPLPKSVGRLDNGGREEFRSEPTTVGCLRPGDLWIDNGYSYEVVDRLYTGEGNYTIVAIPRPSGETQPGAEPQEFIRLRGDSATRRVLLENRSQPVPTMQVQATEEVAPAPPVEVEETPMAEASVFEGHKRPRIVGKDQLEIPYRYLSVG